MSDTGFYILDGRTPVKVDDIEAWGGYMGTANRQVAETFIEGVRVSTVFLGLDHNWFGGVPLLFETMTFVQGIGEWQDRCSTYDQAEAMHQVMCDKVSAHLDAAAMETAHIMATINSGKPE